MLRNNQTYFVRKTCVVLILILFLVLPPITLTVAKKQLVKNNDKSTINSIYLNLSFSTYMGGSDNDKGADIAVDNNGNYYITGETKSHDFPTKLAFDRTYSGGESDAFIAKFFINGSLLWGTFLGGYAEDYATDIAVASDGSCYIVGDTLSSNFPTKNAYDSSYNGNSTNKNKDVFIAKFSTDGALLWSTYLGGQLWDKGCSIALDSYGNCYITGGTYSSDFPIKNGYNARMTDIEAFITKFSASGSLLWSTFLGGNWGEEGYGIDVTSDGCCYVTGYTYSSNFPTKNAYQNKLSGASDVFITEFSTNGSFLWGTYLGGTNHDYGESIAKASDGSCYITGKTLSSNFPTKDAFDSKYDGDEQSFDCFVAKFAANKTLLWSTFLGGSYDDEGYAIATDSNDFTYVTGETFSDDFPFSNAFDTHESISEAFIVKFTTNGSLFWSTFLGGGSSETGLGIVLSADGTCCLVGYTHSNDFPISNAYDNSYNLKGDIFITKLFESTTPQPIPAYRFWEFIVILPLLLIIRRKRKT